MDDLDFDTTPICKFVGVNKAGYIPITLLNKFNNSSLPPQARLGHVVALCLSQYFDNEQQEMIQKDLVLFDANNNKKSIYDMDLSSRLDPEFKYVLGFKNQNNQENIKSLHVFCKAHNNCSELLKSLSQKTLKDSKYFPLAAALITGSVTFLYSTKLIIEKCTKDRQSLLNAYKTMIENDDYSNEVPGGIGLTLSVISIILDEIRGKDWINPNMMDCYNVEPKLQVYCGFLQDKYNQDTAVAQELGLKFENHKLITNQSFALLADELSNEIGSFRRDNLSHLRDYLYEFMNNISITTHKKQVMFHNLLIRADVKLLVDNGDLVRYLKQNNKPLITQIKELIESTPEYMLYKQLC